MTFKDNFCPSPWFHTKITSNGDYEHCRWMSQSTSYRTNISQIHPITWFQKNMSDIRSSMLDGAAPEKCKLCHQMEKHGKVSGRQKQLLKTGVVLQDFEKTMLSSPWLEEWKSTLHNQGHTDLYPQDWQIDLGNFCNSACLFCHPRSSSRLASEYLRLKLIQEMPKASWCDDPVLLDKFINTLQESPNIQYLHFIGGETIITPAFRKILLVLIEKELNKTITLGFTTNLTILDQDLVNLLKQFYQINLGVSIECLHPVNDYIRYGGNFNETLEILDRWVAMAKEYGWLVQMRTTPTILSISYLDTIYEYAWQNQVGVESCNFLDHPEFMRPAVLPMEYRHRAKERLQSWIDCHPDVSGSSQVINTRHSDFLPEQIIQDAKSYLRYLDGEQDQSYRLPELVKYLKIMESSRGNNILDYLPEYEELFRSAGY